MAKRVKTVSLRKQRTQEVLAFTNALLADGSWVPDGRYQAHGVKR